MKEKKQGKGEKTWAGKTFVSRRRTKVDKGKEEDILTREKIRGAGKYCETESILFVEEKNT